MKTSELQGAALDWAVHKAEGRNIELHMFWEYRTHNNMFHYSTSWQEGGPIIERERIQVAPLPDKGWRAHWRSFDKAIPREVWMDCFDEGVTALIAAMRCFVASRLGDEVDIPEELQ